VVAVQLQLVLVLMVATRHTDMAFGSQKILMDNNGGWSDLQTGSIHRKGAGKGCPR
jgi:hypothetical protein